jgi:hypothetical protein
MPSGPGIPPRIRPVRIEVEVGDMYVGRGYIVVFPGQDLVREVDHKGRKYDPDGRGRFGLWLATFAAGTRGGRVPARSYSRWLYTFLFRGGHDDDEESRLVRSMVGIPEIVEYPLTLTLDLSCRQLLDRFASVVP